MLSIITDHATRSHPTSSREPAANSNIAVDVPTPHEATSVAKNECPKLRENPNFELSFFWAWSVPSDEPLIKFVNVFRSVENVILTAP